MKSIMIICSFIFLLAVTGIHSFSDQQPQETPPLTVHQVKGNIYWVKGGSGANAGFYIGKTGVFAIDAKMNAESAKQIVAEIKKLTPLPLDSLIITHSDGDHVNGIGGFPPGLKIIAHEQTKKDMEEAFKKNPADKPLLASLSQQTLTEKMEIKTGADLIQLLHFGPAHTSGDVVVYFPSEKVAFVGDLVFIGRDPLIHKQKGGTSFGLVKNLRALLELDAEAYIPGHNDPLTKQDIQGLLSSIEEKQAKIKDMIKEGKSLDDIKKAFGIESAAGRRWPSLVEIIYQDLTEKK